MSNEAPSPDKNEQPILFELFLESAPLNSECLVNEFWYDDPKRYAEKTTPIAKFYCPKCEGSRRFDGNWKNSRAYSGLNNDFLVYKCRDCNEYTKTFCISFQVLDQSKAMVIKVGEYPDEIIGIPPAMRQIVGDDYKYIVNQ